MSNETAEGKLTLQEVEHCLYVLEKLNADSGQFIALPEDKRVALLKAAGMLSRPDRDEVRKRHKLSKQYQRQLQVQRDREARAATGIRSARTATVFTAPKQIADVSQLDELQTEQVLSSARNCYVCKKEYTQLHHFYDAMCKECGDLNYFKRFQTADLTGQVALITGSRLKIGYQATLMMLRAGATVVATTRFPVDSALRFSKEEDFNTWGHRLHIHGLDLRHIPSVEIFATYIEQHYDRLDILINNAAQTVRRPAGFYQHMMTHEGLPYHDLPDEARVLLHSHHDCLDQLKSAGVVHLGKNNSLPVSWHGNEPGVGLRASAQLSQIPYSFDQSLDVKEVFPEGQLDADLQQVDLRKTNSWRLRLGEIQTPEMLEVQLVNAVAPFVLCNRLIAMMRRDNTGQKHIVNVSAMEGKFHRFKKEDRHPHTNMAKAALNMLTHTSASDLAKDGIYMNAVDTGWVTDEDPAELAKHKEKVHDFQPPLDIVDGAARVCDPFFDGINTGSHWSGKFLKDYFPIDW
ncbi:SDR family oxidoreductase [Fulvivirga ulvae]|uniref:SDR family NAD(P)-dependent oxidoreductase n=1 Tax=Fulvivirga ulvae TaxID=2904245 RepID=UPI001F239B90|nr:SDR family oxidoreductase [Fulvivirga ulvae]UII31513.1 SDR family oxidoreductase [Fulvivirga ulvae]